VPLPLPQQPSSVAPNLLFSSDRISIIPYSFIGGLQSLSRCQKGPIHCREAIMKLEAFMAIGWGDGDK